MAWTDRSTAADVQPRIWLLANGGDVDPGRLLLSKNADANVAAWSYLVSGLDSGLDAVSFTSNFSERQRVFYVKNGGVYMLNFDDDVNHSSAQISAGAQFVGYSIQNTDVGAVTWLDSLSHRYMAVATGATFGGLNGYVCIFESVDLGSWSWWCSTDRPLPQGIPSTHDIVGVIAKNTTTPEFYFRNGFAGLSRAKRTASPPTPWVFHEDLGVPTGLIYASVMATPAQASYDGQIELGIIASNDRIYTSRIAPTGIPSWDLKAPLPGTVIPFSSPAAFGGTNCCGTTGTDREKLFVVGSDFQLYQMASIGTGGFWPSSWQGPYLSPSGLQATVGAMPNGVAAANYQPRVFGAVGYPTYTLQEFASGISQFNDHIKIGDATGVGDTNVKVAESSGAANNSFGIMTAIDRNFPDPTGPAGPWKVRLRSSTDGANSFTSSDSIIAPYSSGAFVADPTVSVTNNPTDLLHHTSVEVLYANGVCNQSPTFTGSNVFYRRGTSAATIATSNQNDGQNGFLIDSDTSGYLDHPWTVTLADGSVHIVYWNGDLSTRCPVGSKVCYWKRDANGTISGPKEVANGSVGLASRPVRAIRGAINLNNEVYAYNDLYSSSGWGKICTLKNVFSPNGMQSTDCGTLGGNQIPAPAGSDELNDFRVNVGPLLGGGNYPPDTGCIPPPSGGHYKCFSASPLVAAAADPVTPYKVYVAYVVAAQDVNGNATSSTIYFTYSTGGSFGTTTWVTPVPLSPTTGIYYDPQITVDQNATIVVSYSSIAQAPGDTSGLATLYLKMSPDRGATWQQVTAYVWGANLIQYHCERGVYFIGDYRDGKVFGNRAYLAHQQGVSGALSMGGHWVSQWMLQ